MKKYNLLLYHKITMEGEKAFQIENKCKHERGVYFCIIYYKDGC